jgi:transmembrane sensor
VIWFRARHRSWTAAQWFAARLHDASRLERPFEQWLAADPRHAEEYALCEITWELSRRAAELVPMPMGPAQYRGRSRPRAAVLAVAIVISGIAIAVWPRAQTWTTAPGERRTVVLSDGSRITLNTRTRLTARISWHAREVQLREGEAFFEVTKDPGRPFTVNTSLGSARALGTRFNVYVDGRDLAVTTEEGRVLVRNSAGAPGVTVDAGHQAKLEAGQPRADLAAADVRAALDWTTGRLDVSNVPLESALRDFSRYTELPVRADSPAIGALRVSGVLRTGDMQALKVLLKGAFGLEVQRFGDEWLVVEPKPPPRN